MTWNAPTNVKDWSGLADSQSWIKNICNHLQAHTLLNVIRKIFENCVEDKAFTALDDTGANEVISLPTDFAKEFDKVPQEGLIIK